MEKEKVEKVWVFTGYIDTKETKRLYEEAELLGVSSCEGFNNKYLVRFLDGTMNEEDAGVVYQK